MRRFFICLVVFLFLFPMEINAQETEKEIQDRILSEFEFSEMDNMLKKLFPKEKIDFKETVLQLICGETELTFEVLKEMVIDRIFYEFDNSKEAILHILLISILAAVLHNFSGVFQSHQTADMCFYVLYMLLITICLNSFQLWMNSIESGISNLIDFLQILGPVYFLAVTIATGSITSIAFYNLILLLIYLVEVLVVHLLLPIIHIFMIVSILNNLSSEEYLSKAAEFIQTLINWSLKALVTGVFGISTIQGLLSPAIDSVKRNILMKSGEAIPVIGDAIGGVVEVVLGTALLIKNGIGIAGTIFCIAICVTPAIQMIIITLLYRLTAALIQPVSEKRMVGCVSSMADCSIILLKVIMSSCLMFLISIAMVAVTTS